MLKAYAREEPLSHPRVVITGISGSRVEDMPRPQQSPPSKPGTTATGFGALVAAELRDNATDLPKRRRGFPLLPRHGCILAREARYLLRRGADLVSGDTGGRRPDGGEACGAGCRRGRSASWRGHAAVLLVEREGRPRDPRKLAEGRPGSGHLPSRSLVPLLPHQHQGARGGPSQDRGSRRPARGDHAGSKSIRSRLQVGSEGALSRAHRHGQRLCAVAQPRHLGRCRGARLDGRLGARSPAQSGQRDLGAACPGELRRGRGRALSNPASSTRTIAGGWLSRTCLRRCAMPAEGATIHGNSANNT